MKNILKILLTLLALSFLCASVHAADTTIVYLDSQRILIESAAGKAVYDRLEAIKNQKQAEIDQKLASLKELGDTISAKSPTMKDSAKQDLELKYEQEQRSYNRFVKDAQEELRRIELSLIKPISDEVNVIIEDYGTKNNIDLILDRRDPGIIFTSKKLDITDDILKLYDKKFQENKGKNE